jgi:hypothetical protein
LGLTVAAFGCLFPTDPDEDPIKPNVRMEGTVYGHFSPSASGFGPGTYTVPVEGAIISTSLDSVTATTDASGHYALHTHTPEESCQPFTVTITAAGRPTYSDFGTWAATGQIFALAPPTPSRAGTNPTCR